MRGSASSARAIAIRWRWPPDSVSPRSPIERVVAVGQLGDEAVGLRALAPPRSTSSRVASGRA